MPKTSSDSGNIPSYWKSWSQNTMVTEDFRPEAEFTLFLCMRTKEIYRQNKAKMYSDERVIPLL